MQSLEGQSINELPRKGQARGAAGAPDGGETITQARSPETQEQLRQSAPKLRAAAGAAGRGFITAIERIDPAFLGDIIIKSTSLQEKVNEALREKGSGYRIGEITITATIPPQIGFAIVRIGDVDEEPSGGIESQHLLAQMGTAAEEVVSLEGGTAPILEEAAGTEPGPEEEPGPER